MSRWGQGPNRIGALAIPLVALALVAAQSAPEAPQAIPDWPLDRLPHFAVAGLDPADSGAVRLVGREQAARLLGVEWPHEPEARRRALEFADNLLRGEEVSVAPDEGAAADGAAVYVLRLPDGLLINLEIIRAGYATASDETFSHARLFRYYARRAREARKGIWAAPAVVAEPPDTPPSASADPSQVTVYVTKSGKKYHLRDCVYLSKSSQPIALEEARKRYSPCSRCKPPP